MTGSTNQPGIFEQSGSGLCRTYRPGTISVRLLREALAETGLGPADRDALLARAGLAWQDLDDPRLRVGVDRYAQIWSESATLSDDEFFGMGSRKVKRGSFAFITKASAEYKMLREATICIVNFYNLLIDRTDAWVVEEEDIFYIKTRSPDDFNRPFSYFTYWLLIHGLMCFLIGQRIPVLAIDLRLEEPECGDDYKVLFTDQIRYGQAENRIIFRSDILRRTIRVSRDDIRRFLEKAPSNILVKYRDEDGAVARIMAVLRRHPPGTWPDFESVAERFGASPSTLRRQLEASGKSFQDLKDIVRRERAVVLLGDPAMSIAAVAEETGFTEASSFHRAFKRWTGFNPGEYRERVLNL
jgi:AraC-like DNA-binding protein